MNEWIILDMALAASLIPALMMIANLWFYRPAPKSGAATSPGVSILIPARNEEASIEDSVLAALQTSDIPFEIVVLDDQSRDRTAALVTAIAREDSRVRLENAPPLPEGWCGKQHACYNLALKARHDHFLFLDADVRLQPNCASRLISFLGQSRAKLVSGIPKQITLSLGEKMLIPLIHFILLCFLPIIWMRKFTHPAFAAGCGQLFLTTRESYFQVGGHAAIRQSLHDGITLPAAYRRQGLSTDLCDATDMATCRMYQGFGQVWNGLGKNATEGLAKPVRLTFFTFFLVLGQVMPLVLLLVFSLEPHPCPEKIGFSSLALFLGYLPRLLAARRFEQSWAGALLHPASILLLLWIQWFALFRQWLGIPSGWKGRDYPTKRNLG